MLKTISIVLLVAVLALQFTGGVGRLERAWPRALCFGLVPDFGGADSIPCAESGGVLLSLRSSIVRVRPPELVPAAPPIDETMTLYFEPRNAFKPEWGVVFPADRGALLTRQCSRVVPGRPEGTWEPNAEQIRRLEMTLTNFLDIWFRRQYLGERSYVPENYYRQYAGVIVWGRRFIYVNGFHRSYVDRQLELAQELSNMPVHDWKRDPAMVCDGGAHYFGALFDPETNHLVDVEFNGVA